MTIGARFGLEAVIYAVLPKGGYAEFADSRDRQLPGSPAYCRAGVLRELRVGRDRTRSGLTGTASRRPIRVIHIKSHLTG